MRGAREKKRSAPSNDTGCQYNGWRIESSVVCLDRVDALKCSGKHFWDSYISRRKPCVMINSLPMDLEWSSDMLIKEAGHAMVEVEVRGSEAELFGQGKKQTMLFGDFMRKVPGQALMYMTTQSRVKGPVSPPANHLVDKFFPRHISQAGGLVLSNLNMWLGASPRGKSTTPLHHDFHDNFYFLARGAKRFTLFAPAEASFMRTKGRVAKVHPNGLINYEGLPTHGDGSTALAVEEAKRSKQLRAAQEELSRAEDAQDEDAIDKAMDALMAFTDGVDGWDNHEEEEEEEGDSEPSCLNHFCEIDAAEAQRQGISSIVVDLKPGEMLYLPCGWFHQVQSGDSESPTANDFHLAVNWWYHPPDCNSPEQPYSTSAWK